MVTIDCDVHSYDALRFSMGSCDGHKVDVELCEELEFDEQSCDVLC